MSPDDVLPAVPEESRFESDPEELLGDVLAEAPGDASGDGAPADLPADWVVEAPDAGAPADVARLTALLRAHERAGRGWPGAGADDVLVEVSEQGLRTRENVVLRDPDGEIRAWGSVHDRAGGRMLFVHVVDRDLPDDLALTCSRVLVAWAEGQAREVGAARGLAVQQIDTGAFAGDERQAQFLTDGGFTRVRTWWQMSRPVSPDEASLVPSPEAWDDEGVRVRLVRRSPSGLPDEGDLRAVHDVLEEAFRDHFNSWEETFGEFVHRLREDPGHRWDHWWLAELLDTPDDAGRPTAVGALVGTELGGTPTGSYVSYIGVLEAARGRGVASGLLRTIIADAASRGRDRVGLEVDADSPTGADGLYAHLGWKTSYTTESWHRDVDVPRRPQR